MSLNIKIKNFGKLADEKISIGQFTVFSGPNNTGKSYVSKLLYSLFDSMNGNPADAYFQKLVSPINRSLYEIRHTLSRYRILSDSEEQQLLSEELNVPKLNVPESDEIESLLSRLRENIFKMSKDIGSCSGLDNLVEISAVILNQKDLMRQVKEDSINVTKKLRKVNIERITKDRKLSKRWDKALVRLDESIQHLYFEVYDTDAFQFSCSGIKSQIAQRLFDNFQIPDLALLRKDMDAVSEVEIENIGNFKLKNSEEVDLEIEEIGLQQLQEYSEVIYLESPIYWKLKPALENLRLSPRFSKRDRLEGVPSYFYDLLSLLKTEYTGDIIFPELYKKLTSKEILGGKITTDTGELRFQEGNRSFSMSLTAIGVVNLGVIALLIERKIINEKTFLFIDEPEAHLHPAWQVIMAEILFDLAKGGVHIVIATDSADILKWLEVHIKRNPDDEKIVALNHFSSDGIVNSDDEFDIKIAKIKEELTRPFADLYIKGIL